VDADIGQGVVVEAGEQAAAATPRHVFASNAGVRLKGASAPAQLRSDMVPTPLHGSWSASCTSRPSPPPAPRALALDPQFRNLRPRCFRRTSPGGEKCFNCFRTRKIRGPPRAHRSDPGQDTEISKKIPGTRFGRTPGSSSPLWVRVGRRPRRVPGRRPGGGWVRRGVIDGPGARVRA
jgi:hypothetical protein